MRHGKKFNHLGRKAAHRKAMLSNMACSLIEHKRIKTTVPKAKALRKYVEPLITKSKNDTTHSRRTVFSYLKQKEAVTELFGDVAAKVANREGGYTRILKTGNRLGDNAEMCIIELVDYNDTYSTDKPKKKTKSTRRSGTKKTADTVVESSTQQVTADGSTVEESKAEEISSAVERVAEEAKAEELSPVEVLDEEVKEDKVASEDAKKKNANENEQKGE